MRFLYAQRERIIKDMKIKTLVVGAVSTNCYIASNEKNGLGLIIDPGDNAGAIEQYLTAADIKPVAILLTHAHFDHIGAVNELSKRYDLPVYMSEAEVEVAGDARLNLSGMVGQAYGIKPTHTLNDDEVLNLADMSIRAILTPGHTKGGMCYYFENEGVLFSGDTLFYESIGRTDFPGGHMGELIRSVKSKIFALPDTTMIYPGHDMPTDVLHEKQYNMFVN